MLLVFFMAAYLDDKRELLASDLRLGPLRLPPIPYLLPLAVMWAMALLIVVVFLGSIPLAYRFGPDNAKWAWLALVALGPLFGLVARLRAR